MKKTICVLLICAFAYSAIESSQKPAFDLEKTIVTELRVIEGIEKGFEISGDTNDVDALIARSRKKDTIGLQLYAKHLPSAMARIRAQGDMPSKLFIFQVNAKLEEFSALSELKDYMIEELRKTKSN